MKLTNLIRNPTFKTSKSFTFHAFGIFSHISSRFSSIKSESSRSKLNAMTFTLQPTPRMAQNPTRCHNTTAQPPSRPHNHCTTIPLHQHPNIGKSIERVRYKKEEKLLKRGFWILGVGFQFWDDCYKIR